MYSDSGNPTLRNITFTHNAADDCGGGLAIWNSSLTLTNVTFSDNFAQEQARNVRRQQPPDAVQRHLQQ